MNAGRCATAPIRFVANSFALKPLQARPEKR